MNKNLRKLAEMLAEEQKKMKETQTETPQSNEIDPIKSLSERFSGYNKPKPLQEKNDPLMPLDQKFVTFKEMNDHYNIFLQRIQQQMSSIGGGGETRLARLDDVDRSTIGEGRHLAYRASDGKFFFEPVQTGEVVQSDWAEANTSADDFIKNKPTNLSDFNNDENFITIGDVPANPDGDNTTIEVSNNVISVVNLPNELIGPIQGIQFDTSAGISVSSGQMAWNSPDGTVDIGLSYAGVVLQVGQETHYVVRNATGNTLPNGTSVYCSGVTAGSGRMEASKFVADGSISPIQYLGLCTMDISNGVNGVVTYFGYVRGLDTRGTANTAISTGTDPGGWTEGTKLYAHPTVAGKLTSVEPTLPEQSICVAVVITRHQNSGVLFVRPTQTIPTSAGDLDNSISLSTLQTVTAASTDFADFQARIAALP
jgi:hypothetical protein